MSRLTSTLPFNKPSPFDLTNEPASSSSSLLDRQHSTHDLLLDYPFPHQSTSLDIEQQQQAMDFSRHSLEHHLPAEHQHAVNDPYSSRVRRLSTLNYNPSGVRESFQPQARQRSKWLLVVVPSPGFDREPQVLGHGHSSCPPGRFAGGILIPLLSTMYAQLTAVAREFGMPSTTGVSLYLHAENRDVIQKPRLSEDTWPYVWAHVLEDTSIMHPRDGPPIAGTIEFDIDARKGKWMDSWLGKTIQPHVDTQTAASSTTHSRQPSLLSLEVQSESRTETDVHHDNLVAQRGIRRVPRRLSLLEGRLDLNEKDKHSRGRYGSPMMTINPRLEPLKPTSIVLSPVAQVDEPITAKERDLRNRVASWIDASPVLQQLEILPQPYFSHDESNPASLPHSPTKISNPFSSENPTVVASDATQIDLNDYAWSRSSEGPRSDTFSDLGTYSRAMSVDLARRIEGSICLTPSVATSFGPDTSHYCDDACSWDERLPSPDLGYRGLYDAPCTPSEATSWGPSSRASSLASPQSYSSSVDIGHRCMFSTCSSLSTLRGSRFDDAALPAFPAHTGATSIHSFPYYNAWHQVPWRHQWPYTAYHNDTELNRHNERANQPLPKDGESEVAQSQHQIDVRLESCYPTFSIYPDAYPHLEVYPPAVVLDFQSSTEWAGRVTPRHDGAYTEASPVYPNFDIYPAVYPNFDIYPSQTVVRNEDGRHHIQLSSPHDRTYTEASPVYPNLIIYPAVYPNFDIYPSQAVVRNEDGRHHNQLHDRIYTEASPVYPNFVIYPAVYPNFDIYPPQALVRNEDGRRHNQLSARDDRTYAEASPVYPNLDIYPAVYPNINIYPAQALVRNEDGRHHRQLSSPHDRTYTEASPVYPNFIIYPAVYPEFDLYFYYDLGSKKDSPQDRQLPTVYPNLCIYPAINHNSEECTLAAGADLSSIRVDLDVAYPYLDLYHPVYPCLEPYRAKIYGTDSLEGCRSLARVTPLDHQDAHMSLAISHIYPWINIYQTVYPSIEVYPDLFQWSKVAQPHHEIEASASIQPYLLTAAHSHYPTLVIYPVVYPNFDLYPCPSADISDSEHTQDPRLSIRYPQIVPYPAVYPHIDIYLGATLDNRAVRTLEFTKVTSQLLEYTYPSIMIYPSITYEQVQTAAVTQMSRVTVPTVPEYYPATYPINPVARNLSPHVTDPDISQPPVINTQTSQKQFRFKGRQRRSHYDLHCEVFMPSIPVLSSKESIPQLDRLTVTPLAPLGSLERKNDLYSAKSGIAKTNGRVGNSLVPIPSSSASPGESHRKSGSNASPTAAQPVPHTRRNTGLGNSIASRTQSLVAGREDTIKSTVKPPAKLDRMRVKEIWH